MATTYQTTKDLKESRVDWIGRLPEDWGVSKFKAVFKPSNERVKDDPKVDTILAISGYRGSGA